MGLACRRWQAYLGTYTTGRPRRTPQAPLPLPQAVADGRAGTGGRKLCQDRRAGREHSCLTPPFPCHCLSLSFQPGPDLSTSLPMAYHQTNIRHSLHSHSFSTGGRWDTSIRGRCPLHTHCTQDFTLPHKLSLLSGLYVRWISCADNSCCCGQQDVVCCDLHIVYVAAVVCGLVESSRRTFSVFQHCGTRALARAQTFSSRQACPGGDPPPAFSIPRRTDGASEDLQTQRASAAVLLTSATSTPRRTQSPTGTFRRDWCSRPPRSTVCGIPPPPGRPCLQSPPCKARAASRGGRATTTGRRRLLRRSTTTGYTWRYRAGAPTIPYLPTCAPIPHARSAGRCGGRRTALLPLVPYFFGGREHCGIWVRAETGSKHAQKLHMAGMVSDSRHSYASGARHCLLPFMPAAAFPYG